MPPTLILPNDILDRILQWSPTFQTLLAAICVSKTWYNVFQTHPKSTLRSVARNVVGPALADAVRVLRYANNEDSTGSDEEFDAFSKEEFIRLRVNANVVNELEAIFSLRYRDTMSQTSKLTLAESLRFTRAMYRIMLYCDVFSMPDDEDSVIELEENERDEIVSRRTAMLDKYSTNELVELNATLTFLRSVALGSGGEDGDFDDDDDAIRVNSDMLISPGPASVLEAHQCQEISTLVEQIGDTVWSAGPFSLLLDFFAAPLQIIWNQRQVDAPSNSDEAMREILLDKPEVSPSAAACDRCGRRDNTQLRKEANWNELHLDLRPLLRGKITGNFTDMGVFDDAKPNKNIPRIMAELFEIPRTEDEFKDWNKSDALCSPCLNKFVSAHLHIWLLERKLKDGYDALEDCPDGYDCQEQTEVTLHALTHNHLCAPKKKITE
ncbi:hypothetical protein R3P38DRAFT_3581934 [Favolaschia claudopus]|uniref:F-box domain-containing protein n=1 Tax=Favolaschia claudopus TaxID=2862362 RepID=A0AAW0AKJ8_9AGAR